MNDIWFKGPISEAVKHVSEKKLVLLVYIYDDSEKSKTLETQFHDEQVMTTIKEKGIALKLKQDSNDAAMFGQLYPISQVPVVYFLIQGTIKDIGFAELTSQEILHRINAVAPNSSIKDKLVDMNKKRTEEEKKKVQEQEIKRRQEGKLAQETHSQLKEQQNKTYLEQIKREKKEQEEYKKRIKEHIARDRADQSTVKSVEKQPMHETSQNFHDHCNLNIKQLDGTSLKQSFSPSDTLINVSNWIDTSRTDGDMPYKLFAQFPNRNFDIGDEQRTLLELKLCPSATLIMKPVKNVTHAYTGSSTSGGWFNYLSSIGNNAYQSISDMGSSVASYLVSPTTVPEPGQRLGGGSNINTLNDTKYKNEKETKQTYNGNSVNQE